MAVGTLWYAQQAEVHILANTLTDAECAWTTATLEGIFRTKSTIVDWTGRCSDLSISGGSRDLTAVNTLGINQLEQGGRPDIMEATFTLIFKDSDSAAYIAGTPIVSTAINCTWHNSTGTYNRYQYGEKSTATADRAKLAVLFLLSNSSTTANKTVYCLMNQASLTDRELSLSADGYVEEKWTVKCLAQNYYEEDNFSG